jgi:mono/diheme cytochrome c family protein
MRYSSFFATCIMLGAAGPALAQAKVEYNRDIRPILAENCFACHGPDSASRKAGLRLDQRDAAVEGEAILPGQPDKSALVERVFSDDKAHQMPPPKTNKKLTAAQKDLLKRWIASGAEYQAHWSYIPPTRPALPKVKNQAWVRNPIDAFILAKLEAAGLQPAPEADLRTLARRLSLDIVGVPPTPAQVEELIREAEAAKPQAALDKYIDRLMQSPHWGEHRGRYWLDYARYADTHGLHFDNYREMYSYRDWVIDAFNRNLSFDKFTIEQLAGDLLPNRTLDQQIASGFNRCNLSTNEGGTILEENLVMYTRDRTETVGWVFLGLTMNCCTCHDHKFDPISQADFYSLSAFFNNNTVGALDGNIRDTPPIVFVPRREDRPRWEALAKDLADVRGQLEARKKEARPAFDQWLTTANADTVGGQAPTQDLRLHARLSEGKGKAVQIDVAGKPRTVNLAGGFEWVAGKIEAKAFALKPGASIEIAEAGDFEKDQAFSVGAWLKLTKRNQAGALVARMDNGNNYRGWDLWTENDRVGMHIVNKWQDDALKVVAKQQLKPNQWYHVFVSYDGSAKAAGVKVYIDGQLQPVDVFADSLKSTIRTTVPLKVGQRHTSERLSAAVLQDVRLYGRSLPPAEVDQLAKATRVAAVLAKEASKRSPQEVGEVYDWWLTTSDQPSKDLQTRLGELQQEEVGMKSRGTIAHVMQERDSEPTAYVLYRGEYDKRRAQVKAATPKALPAMPGDLPRNRLGFAQWLLRPEHPLTARVTVNRFWQELFGTGIVKTTSDLGVSGELPSHPELLDWLAVEFRESGWDMKRLFKTIFTSNTYRQSSVVSKAALEKDPSNVLLSRGPRYRLDAEMLRDYALASSGLLVRKVGGPSVKPYQPPGVWEAVAMNVSNTANYKEDRGESLYRRSMYWFWKRAAPPASMDILNAPSREFCTVRRERTNTPLQALVTLNDPQFVEAARALAQRTLKESAADDVARFNYLGQHLMARPFRGEELGVVQRSLSSLLAYYRAQPKDAEKLLRVGELPRDTSQDGPTLAAWTMLANQLMNLDEVLNK